MLDYGFSCWNLNRIWLRTAASNVRAIKCYTGVGFVEEGRLRSNEWYQGAFNDTVVMGMLRTDWEALAPKG